MARMLDKFKKSKPEGQENDDGLDILTNVKEPFSFSGFFETHVVERAKRIKTILSERGVLFFLFSPFQARGRLIAQICLLIVGIMFGVIPRASTLVNALQEQAYESEIAGLEPKTVGSIQITPAASSNYKRLHMLGFIVTGKNLPSDASKYDVHLARGYGASDWEDVTYSWTMYPVDDTRRILLVAIDQSEQASGYGAFQLYIQLAGEEVKDYAKTPFEITLSSAQPTQELYDREGIHLSALTDAILGTGAIADAQAEFEEALANYQIAIEQAENYPVDIHVTPTKDDLETYCMANRIYRALDDDSTSEDILQMPKEIRNTLSYDVVITSDGIPYDKTMVETLEGGDQTNISKEDKLRFEAFHLVEEAKEKVISKMEAVNTEAEAWYNAIDSMELILNQTIKFDTFPLYARCTNLIDDPINYIDHVPGTDDDPGSGGIVAPNTGDDPAATPAAFEEPSITDNPVYEDPATEEPSALPEPQETPGNQTDDGDTDDKPATTYHPSQTITGDPADSK